jgi:hypothetical protein
MVAVPANIWERMWRLVDESSTMRIFLTGIANFLVNCFPNERTYFCQLFILKDLIFSADVQVQLSV